MTSEDIKHQLIIIIMTEPELVIYSAQPRGCDLHNVSFSSHYIPALNCVGRSVARLLQNI